uniref:Uncharacterized protein n=1 Tax=Anguilla anguilla TaxID=7936 RepID=A0A0E9VL95_ANGAN
MKLYFLVFLYLLPETFFVGNCINQP